MTFVTPTSRGPSSSSSSPEAGATNAEDFSFVAFLDSLRHLAGSYFFFGNAFPMADESTKNSKPVTALIKMLLPADNPINSETGIRAAAIANPIETRNSICV